MSYDGQRCSRRGRSRRRRRRRRPPFPSRFAPVPEIQTKPAPLQNAKIPMMFMFRSDDVTTENISPTLTCYADAALVGELTGAGVDEGVVFPTMAFFLFVYIDFLPTRRKKSVVIHCLKE